MSNAGKLIVAIVIVALIAGGAVLLTSMSSDTQNTNESSTNSETDSDDTDTTPDASNPAVTITYNGSAFSLSATSMKAGGAVRVVNASQDELYFASDPHPAHTNNPELNANNIAPGESKTFTLNTKGVWGFHNHLKASQKGELTVE